MCVCVGVGVHLLRHVVVKVLVPGSLIGLENAYTHSYTHAYTYTHTDTHGHYWPDDYFQTSCSLACCERANESIPSVPDPLAPFNVYDTCVCACTWIPTYFNLHPVYGGWVDLSLKLLNIYRAAHTHTYTQTLYTERHIRIYTRRHYIQSSTYTYIHANIISRMYTYMCASHEDTHK